MRGHYFSFLPFISVKKGVEKESNGGREGRGSGESGGTAEYQFYLVRSRISTTFSSIVGKKMSLTD